jgi:hypothetical protein
VAGGDGLDDDGRLKAEAQQACNGAMVTAFSFSQCADGGDLAYDKVVGQTAGAGDGFEQRQIDPVRSGIAGQHHAQLDAAPFNCIGIDLTGATRPGR